MIGFESLRKICLSLGSYVLILITGILNFSWNISDHDDGHTIGYHVFGRNSELQRVYGEYDSMCDALLGLLPANYYWVFGAMMVTTFIASFLVISFLKRIVLKITDAKKEIVDVAAIVFLLAMPEYLYICFTFKSVIISLTFVLFSYYLLLIRPQSKYPGLLFLLSILIFGFGVSLRWNHLAYGLAIVTDLVYTQWQINGFKVAFKSMLIWGIGALISIVSWIFISGYSPVSFANVILWGKSYIENTDFQFVARIGDASLFLLPFTLIVFISALWKLFNQRQRNVRLLILLITSIMPYLVLGLAPSFKYLSMLWLLFFVFFVLGLSYFHKSGFFSRRFVRFGLGFALLFPWFVGVQIDIPSSNWGPGFDVKDSISISSSEVNKLRLDDRFKLNKVRIFPASGIALPTSEGMRPLWGHFYALWGGGLKDLDEKLNKEADNIISNAVDQKTVVWVDRINPYFLASLSKEGFIPDQSWQQDGFYTERTFKNPEGHTLGEFRINNPKNLFKTDSITQKYSGKTIFAFFTYTSALNKLVDMSKSTDGIDVQRMGPLSARIIID